MINGVDRCPQIGIVAIFADIRGRDMRLIFSRRVDAIVTTGTIGNNIDVIKIGRSPCHRGVTVIALTAGSDVSRIFPCGYGAVVTGITRAQHLRVVDRVGRCPNCIVVAVFTNVSGLDVRGVLAGYAVAIVTSNTSRHDTRVVEIGWQPCHGRMAIVAINTSRDMRRVLADSDGAVVAGTTGTQNLGVVDRIGGCPQRIVVAILTDIGGLNMRRILARGTNTIVTGGAATDDTGVIEVGR